MKNRSLLYYKPFQNKMIIFRNRIDLKRKTSDANKTKIMRIFGHYFGIWTETRLK
jgi:hypothetical protein